MACRSAFISSGVTATKQPLLAMAEGARLATKQISGAVETGQSKLENISCTAWTGARTRPMQACACIKEGTRLRTHRPDGSRIGRGVT
jgi:hypothetical protein